MQQIVEFLGYLQKVKVAHKDLKLENILVTAEMKIKVIDFDFAENTSSGKLSKDYGGTKVYMAPEVLANKAHDGHRADMYAAGVILFAIVVGSFPFSKADDNGYKLFCSNPKQWTAIFLNGYSDDFIELMKSMLHLDPELRPSV